MTEVPTRRPHGAPCWVSLLVHNLDATQRFYSGLFGWEFEGGPQPLRVYARAELNGRPVAGIGEMSEDRHAPTAWTTYFASDDVDLTTELIRDCGGTVGVGPLDLADAGRMALASDPSGAVFGVWQPQALHGAEVVGEPGSLAWNELLTWDASAAAKFYSCILDCDVASMDAAADFDYLTLQVAGRPVAGVHGVGQALPRDRGAHWMTYFAVKDTDEAVERVADLGGRVLDRPRDSAYGRLATVADCEGAVFTLIRPSW